MACYQRMWHRTNREPPDTPKSTQPTFLNNCTSIIQNLIEGKRSSADNPAYYNNLFNESSANMNNLLNTQDMSNGMQFKNWDNVQPKVEFDDDFKLEYMDLDEFLTENDLPIDSVLNDNNNDANNAALLNRQNEPSASTSQILDAMKTSGTDTRAGTGAKFRSTSFCSSNGTTSPVAPNAPNIGSSSGLFPGGLESLEEEKGSLLPRVSASFSEEDLKSLPVRKRKKQMVSEDSKDEKYWERRRKNNIAAKRSRDARRAKENQIALRATFLERENKILAEELTKARTENHLLKERLCNFGKRVGGASRRHNECLILEPSEMIVIDYVDGRARTERISDASGSTLMRPAEPAVVTVVRPLTIVSQESSPPPPPPRLAATARPPLPDRRLIKLGSDSAYSESADESQPDLTGLMESVVDSDEDEDEDSNACLGVRDAVRECLEKDPSDRGPTDIEKLLEFTQHLSAFTNMTLGVRRELVSSMVFAVVEKAGTIVMTDGEELDSWSVIINGNVEIIGDDEDNMRILGLGDSFGITPTMEKLFHKGIMRTKSDDCQFVCVTQSDYYRILHQGRVSQKSHYDANNQVVLVTENRDEESQLVIRGTKEQLMMQLMENTTEDTTFVEDFLLTYRTFIKSPVELIDQLIEWFDEDNLRRDKVTRVILLWVNNHFTDFELHRDMMAKLEIFEQRLKTEKMFGQLRMLHFACAAKARARTITLSRPSRDEPLPFTLADARKGNRESSGVFIASVKNGSKADEMGLRKGDQVLEVNGQVFTKDKHCLKVSRVEELMKSVCHLSITVKSNLLIFNELIVENKTSNGNEENLVNHDFNNDFNDEDNGVRRSRGKSVGSVANDVNNNNNEDEDWLEPIKPSVRTASPTPSSTSSTAKRGNHGKNTNRSSRLNRALNKILKPRSLISVEQSDPFIKESKQLVQSARSQPDLTRLRQDDHHSHQSIAGSPEHVLKIYRGDQSFKYLMVHRETKAKEIVLMALNEFGMVDEPCSNFGLCEVSVAEGGFVKQRRLNDDLANLAERIGLNSRYYIKSVQNSEPLLPDESALELIKESQQLSLLHLNPVEVATQLMVEDFTIFRQIEATEYIDDLFGLQSEFGVPNLALFSELVNREMMWSVTEVVSELNAGKRMRIIKQLIKVARQCRETQNFNSMFAIVSGLGHRSVSRLRHSWEKLPSKYLQLFNEMQQLMDPSRNMSRYRNLVCNEDTQPPIIPFWPVVKKDLTFIHIANDSEVEGLVNFDKMRMIAKEIRSLRSMCSAPLDLFSMLELGGQSPSKAMVALNQLSTISDPNRRRNHTNNHLMTHNNPKKMFEEAQMVRRVKAYLNNMNIVMDENRLQQMSMQCEPCIQHPHQTALVNHRINNNQTSVPAGSASPTPSARSSTSSTTSTSSASQQSVVPAPKAKLLHKADSEPINNKASKENRNNAEDKNKSRKNGSVTSADSGLVIMEAEDELVRTLRDQQRLGVRHALRRDGQQRVGEEQRQRLRDKHGMVWDSLPTLRLRLSHELASRDRAALAPPRPPKTHRRSAAPILRHHDPEDHQVSAV